MMFHRGLGPSGGQSRKNAPEENADAFLRDVFILTAVIRGKDHASSRFLPRTGIAVRPAPKTSNSQKGNALSVTPVGTSWDRLFSNDREAPADAVRDPVQTLPLCFSPPFRAQEAM